MPVKLRKSRSGNVTKSNNRPVSKQSRNRKTPKGKGNTNGKGKRTRRRVKRGGAESAQSSQPDAAQSSQPDAEQSSLPKPEHITEAMKKHFFGKTDVSDEELKKKLINFLIKLPLLELKNEPLSGMSELQQAKVMCGQHIEDLASEIIFEYLDKKYRPEFTQTRKYNLLHNYVRKYLAETHGITCTIELIDEVNSNLNKELNKELKK